MALLSDTLARAGERFFRWRSFLPLLLLPLAALALPGYHYPWGSPLANEIWWFCCACFSTAGLGLRFLAVGYSAPGTSGRNTRGQVADTLNTTGVYSIVRNPLYVGNFIIGFGLSLTLRNVWFALVVILFYVIFYERIIYAEERFLAGKFGDLYRRWAARVPAVLPRLRGWLEPDRPFSVRKVLRQEPDTYINIVLVFTLLKVASDGVAVGYFYVNPLWAFWLVISVVIYAVLKVLSKTTSVLED